MGISFLSLPGSDIPDSPAFKIAFVIVTVLYVISMAVLFVLYKKSVKNIPAMKDKDSEGSEDKNVKNR